MWANGAATTVFGVLFASLFAFSGSARAGGGDCCSSNGTPGCQSTPCEQFVCSFDPFCCETEWDGTCGNIANLICSICGSDCGDASAGDCCSANGSPGCDNANCCAIVCQQFAFCCESSWSTVCSLVAAQECFECGASACCFPDGSCDNMDPDSCDAAGGTPDTGGACNQVECPVGPTVCCHPTGSCLDDVLSITFCLVSGGTLQPGPCSQVQCPGPEGACCTPDGSCVAANQVFCENNQAGIYLHGVTCDEMTCVTGACCTFFVPVYVCTENTFYGVCKGGFLGEGSTCGDINCTPGACCLADGTCEGLLNEFECMSLGGDYQGEFTNCSDVDCTVPVGACCLVGTCSDSITQKACLGKGGDYQGDGTDCQGVQCSSPGACCLVEITCTETLTQIECLNNGGEYMGDGVECQTVECASPGACCALGGGVCFILLPEECLAVDGEPFPGGCSPGLCVACPTDTDGNGATDVSDLVNVILTWGSDDEVTDVTGDGIVNVQDLVEIILNWGPCV